ncbi:hypothetical protein BDZ89DRAFT_1152478 [Hymenopellis radicata]|nr:hypothetical protein BDZ89DRAFT_1152478 [Hymenopellis radicata]
MIRNLAYCVVNASSKEDPPKVAKPKLIHARQQETVLTRASSIGFGSPKIGARAVANSSPERGHDKVVYASPVVRMLVTNAVLIRVLCRASGDLDLQCKMTRPRTMHQAGAQDSKAQKSSSSSSSLSFLRREHFQIQEKETSQRVVGLEPLHRRALECAPEHIRGRSTDWRKAKPHGNRERTAHKMAVKTRKASTATQGSRFIHGLHCHRQMPISDENHSHLGFYGIVTKVRAADFDNTSVGGLCKALSVILTLSDMQDVLFQL